MGQVLPPEGTLLGAGPAAHRYRLVGQVQELGAQLQELAALRGVQGPLVERPLAGRPVRVPETSNSRGRSLTAQGVKRWMITWNYIEVGHE